MRRGPAGVAIALTLAIAATGAPPPAHARAAALPLEVRLARALVVEGISPSQVSALVVDLRSGVTVFQQLPALPLAPASAEKLPVSLAALAELGPSYRFRTLVLGRGERSGSTWRGDLVLKGFGDPSLASADLARLAAAVAARGIERVTGSIVGDESFYDSRRTAPGWKPAFYKTESPPLSALVVDRAYFEGKTRDRPALVAARQFRAALRAHGIAVRGKAALGRAAATTKLPVLAKDESVQLDALVRAMNTESDNFVAEMVLKQLGAVAGGAGTTRAGSRVVGRVLGRLDVRLGGVALDDGSGLSYSDRLTANALVDTLAAGRAHAEVADPFLGSLAVAGETGTLEDRFERGPARGVVRAKTGTTAIASALAGLVGERYAFAILMNDEEIDYWRARRAQDRFVTILARQV